MRTKLSVGNQAIRLFRNAAMAIAGGVLLSTIISFFLVPPLFLLTRSGRGDTTGTTKGASIEPYRIARELAA